MRVLLVPMEGVLDSLVRELLTEVNDYDLCITEFLRVVDQLLPVKSFYRLCPELPNASRTPAGTRVRLQLLKDLELIYRGAKAMRCRRTCR
nr:ATP-dependent RNA helicase RhlE [Candidatus Pantoea persica]